MAVPGGARRTLSSLLAAGACLLAAVAVGRAQQPSPEGIPAPSGAGGSRSGSHVPGEILVKLRDAADAEELSALGRVSSARRGELASVLGRYGLSGTRRPFLRARSRRLGAGSRPPLDQVVKLVSPLLQRDPQRLRDALAALRARPEVEYAEPNAILRAQWVPSDPYVNSSGSWSQSFGDLWGLQKIRATEAWDASLGAGVTVAVIDTGIDAGHVDIAANVWQNAGEVGLDGQGADKRGNGLDDDGNGFVDDWWGWDFTSATPGDNDPDDDHGHGTHVAGTIAAVADNNEGIAGVAPLARVMALKGLGAFGSGTSEAIANAILYAADNGAEVINLSLGGYGETPRILEDAIGYAHDVHGVVVVAAAGNSNWSVGSALEGFFPANIRDAIAVAAFDHNDAKATFSNHGAKIDVAAPGGGGTEPAGIADPHRTILSLLGAGAGSSMTGGGALIVDGSYLRQAGTSMAAPHVAGLAALVRSLHPGFSPENVRQALRTSAEDVGGVGFDLQAGYGRIDAGRALLVDAPLAVQLVEPIASFPVTVAQTVRGTASGPGMLDWILEQGRGSAPAVWTTILSSTTPVEDGALTVWDATGLADGEYTLRLTGRSGGGFYEDRMAITIDSVSITSPGPGTNPIYRAGESVSISGTAAPAGFAGYRLVIDGKRSGPVVDPRVTLVGDGQSTVVDGPLGSWDTSGLPADHYEVCLRVDLLPVGSSQECTSLIVDPALHPGWPVNVGALGSGAATLALIDHLIAADLDGDGAGELLVAYSSDVRVLDHTGGTLPGWPQTIDPNGTGARIQSGPAAADVTGDGIPEVIALNDRGEVFAWHDNGTPLPGWPRALLPGWGSVAAADLDADGKAEILATSGNVTVAVDQAGAALPGWPRYSGGMIAVGDVDGDGAKEVVTASRFSFGRIYVYRADGSLLPGWPRDVNPNMPPGYSHAVHPALADLDGDGADEIVANARDGQVYVFRHDGTQMPGWPQATQPAAVVNPPAVGDVDGDGLPDVVAGTDRVFGVAQNRLYVWRADGTLLPGWPVEYDAHGNGARTFFGFGAPALADLDGDGAAEIIVSSDGGDFALHAYAGDGGEVGDFPRPTRWIGTAAGSAAAIADLDADGLLELAWVDGNFDLFAWDLSAPGSAAQPWPMFRRDGGHRARYLSHRLILLVRGGGRVDVDPSGATCASTQSTRCEYDPDPASVVTLTATPDAGHLPAGWGGACPDAAPTCELSITGYHEVVVTFTPNTAPVADAGGPYGGSRHQSIAFDGSASSDPDGQPLSYSWDFGDGTTATGPTPTHSYAALGTHVATLTVNDGVSDSFPATATVTIVNQPPVAIPGGPYAGVDTAPVVFDGTASADADGDPITLSWDFGDGATQSGPGPSHHYTLGGNYTVTLFVSDGYDTVSATTTAAITDTIAPAAVSDLSAAAAGSMTARLTWTATGDSGTEGSAARYDLRYSGQPITVESFAVATPVQVGLDPSPAGTEETLDVPGLLPQTSYYFALEVEDQAGHVSPLSNVAAVTTSEVLAFLDDAESGAGAWVIEGTDGAGGPALWHVATHRHHSPTRALYYGVDATTTYDTGARNYGTLTSPPIDLDGATGSYAAFQYFLETEGPFYDKARVYVSSDGGASWLQQVQLPAAGAMTPWRVDLSAYDGQTIRLRFGFDTIDSIANAYEGWVVDDILVAAAIRDRIPVADAGGPYAGSVDQSVAFDGTASADPEGAALTYSWDFGDGAMGTGAAPIHAYASRGVFAVNLVVDDGSRASVAAATTAAIDNRSPVADPAGPYSGVRDEPVAFDASGSIDPDGDGLTYSWDFGDGATSAGAAPSHAYAASGSYTVSLVVADGVEESPPSATTVTIVDPPDITAISPGSGPVGGGTAVTIQGGGFGTAQGTGGIRFGGVPATSYTQWSPSRIVCLTPAHAAGVVDVSVTTANGHADTAPAAFAYVTPASLPYVEDFELGGSLPAGWQQATADDFDWTVDAGGTSSSATGPSADHTLGSAAGYYVYTEASYPNYPSKRAELSTPILPTGGATQLTLEFWYHLYGSAIGSLHVDVNVDGVWHDDVTSPLSGNLGDQWRQHVVDLSAYSGSSIQIRFRGVTGASYAGDMAIDDVSLTDAPIAPAITALSPQSGPIGGGTTVTIDGSRFGDARGTGSVWFGGAVASAYVSWSDSRIVCVAPPHAAGAADVTVSASNGTAVTANAAFSYVGPISAFPHTESFEAGAPLPAGWAQAADDDFDWLRDSGGTPSSGTGPAGDHTLGTAAGYYLYTESSSPNYPSKRAGLLSPLFDIAGLSQPRLVFWSHMLGSGMGTLHVDLFVNGARQDDVMPPISGDQGNLWQEHSLDLSAYPGVVQVQFRVVTGSSFTSDVAIDDFAIIDQ